MGDNQQAQKERKPKKSSRFFNAVSRWKKPILIFLGFLLGFHVWLHYSNPYAQHSFFKNPYSTNIKDGLVEYKKEHNHHFHSSEPANLAGYYKSGYLIAENSLFGANPIKSSDENKIIAGIHAQRFDPSKPYLISGDQFSVLYPRNLGIFYNQILDPNTALSQDDWQNRQQIYLQSVLYAVDGLSSSPDPRTTIVPISPKSSVLTQVHPGGIGSDSVFGVLYAIDKLNTPNQSEKYQIQTEQSAQKLLGEKKQELKFITERYVSTVQDPQTKLVKKDLHLSGARDGVIRKSSFYDNVVLWKTLQLAKKYNLYGIQDEDIDQLKNQIKNTYWNEQEGFYNNDAEDKSFSSDWLVGYHAGFFNLDDEDDLYRTKRTISYVRANNLAEPLPIKYQKDSEVSAPFFVDKFVPNYGSTAIWSYWGSEYITLLANAYRVTGDKSYLDEASRHLDTYEQKIIQYGGFPETFNEKGEILQSGIYKSILITGWVVQYEHARQLVDNLKNL